MHYIATSKQHHALLYMLSKLSYYGFRGASYNLLCDYLSVRICTTLVDEYIPYQKQSTVGRRL